MRTWSVASIYMSKRENSYWIKKSWKTNSIGFPKDECQTNTWQSQGSSRNYFLWWKRRLLSTWWDKEKCNYTL